MRPITAVLTITALAAATLIAVSASPARAHAATAPQPKIEQTSLDTYRVQQLSTHHRRHRTPLRVRALRWARAQRGKPYEWGQTGPYGFDCSGLVMAAYHHAGGKGRRLGRDTYDMLGQVGTLLIRVRHPKPGDLAFYGTGHVELWLGRMWKWHRHGNWFTWGAQQPGTAVGAHRIWWGNYQPTAYYRIA